MNPPLLPRAWAAAAALLAVALLGGCAAASVGSDTGTSTGNSTGAASPAPSAGSPSGPASTPTTPSTPTAPTTPAVRTIGITVTGRTVTPAPAVVDLGTGEVLRLVVTVDHDDELHAHGFDVGQPLVAGQPTTVDLTADEPGRYEVETHEPALRLLVVQVR